MRRAHTFSSRARSASGRGPSAIGKTDVLFKRPKIPPPRPPDLPFDEEARDALGRATDQARSANATAVHAEHLLLALLADPDGLVARAFTRLGHPVDDMRRRVEHAAPPRPWGLRAPVLPFADDVKGAIEFAMIEARAAARTQVGPAELVLGVVQSPRGAPARVIAIMDMSPGAIRAALKAESE
nr:Clp protease N-terminal domain-containing protein [Longimicrobium terrae]